MIQFKTSIYLSLAAILLIASGCTDAPIQYEEGTPPVVKRDDTNIPTKDTLIQPRAIENQQDEDEERRELARKPIVYGVGAGGIDFETSITAAEKLLPEVQNVRGRESYYGSGFLVIWNTSVQPNVPFLIFTFGDYIGKMAVPSDRGEGNIISYKDGSPLSEFGIGSDLTQYFDPEYRVQPDPSDKVATQQWLQNFGRKFTTKLHQLLEDPEDADCLATKACSRGLQDIGNGVLGLVVSLPQMTMLVSVDRLSVIQVALNIPTSLARLNNVFDIISGQFYIEGLGGNRSNVIEFGQDWGTIKSKIDHDGVTGPKTNVAKETRNTRAGSDSFVKDFEGASLGLTRTQGDAPTFDLDYKQPRDDEKLKFVFFTSQYTVPLVFKNNAYVVKNIKETDEEAVVLEALPIDQAFGALPENTTLLSMGLELPNKQKQDEFHNALKGVIEGIWNPEENPNWLRLSYSSGFYSKDPNVDISNSTVWVNKETGLARSFGFDVNRQDGEFRFAYIDKIPASEDNKIAYSSLANGLDLTTMKTPSLAGLTLGDRVRLKDSDWSRGEATVSVKRGESAWSESRREAFNYENSVLVLMPDEEQLNTKEAVTVSFGDENSLLALSPVSDDVDVAGKQFDGEYEITLIRNGRLNNGIKGLCGIEDFQVDLSISANDFVAQLDEAIANAKTADRSFACNHSRQVAIDGSGRLEYIFFRNHNLRIAFGDGAVGTVTFYNPAKFK